jgi:multimeric flavodoxin WrbA
MKVLILNGSPRKNGNVARLLTAIGDGMKDVHEVEWIEAYDLAIKPCRGCMKCRPDRPCSLPEDDGQLVGRKIKEAGALVIGTPTYWGNMSAPLKALFDRNVTTFEYIDRGLPRPLHKGKEAIIVTASSAPWPLNYLHTQAAGAIRSVKLVLKSGGYKIAGTINLANTRTGREIPGPIIKRSRKIGQKI